MALVKSGGAGQGSAGQNSFSVQFSGISLAFGDRDILKNINLRITSGSRSCLTGANGSGKSTLMKIIAGKSAADSGDRAVQKGTRISYLPQSGIVHCGSSLRDEAETAFSFIHTIIKRYEEVGGLLEKAKAGESSANSLIDEHHNLHEQIEASGYYRREAEVSMVLKGLGFSLSDLERDTGEFSGGWQMRIALAKVLLEKPDVLLLDEPTNYLDIEARSWLEEWLNTFPGGYLLVSHDRYFLDMCVDEVLELFNGNLKRYVGNYSAYEKIRQVELAGLVKRYEEQQEEIIKTEALIRRFRYKASKAAFAQELIKRLDKMERIQIPESFKKININFPPPPHSGNIALTLEGIGKSYGERRVLSGLDLCIDAKERLVVAGVNGAGKSTLLRIIAGADSNYDGVVKYGSGIKAGFFSQDAAEALNSPESIIEFMESQSPTALIPKLRDMLGAFLFRGDDVYKSVSVLSGGEKSRLALLKMFLKPMNLLILDEPTNHLDLYSKDILLDALKKFSGTIIFVSHDRAFMEALSTKTLELRPAVTDGTTAAQPASAKLFYGNYAYYLEKSEIRNVKVEMDNTPKKAPYSGADKETNMMLSAENDEKLENSQKVFHDGNLHFSQMEQLDVQEGNLRYSSINQVEIPEQRTQSAVNNSLTDEKTGGIFPGQSAQERRLAEKQRQTVLRRIERQEKEILTGLEELDRKKNHLEAELARPEVYSSGEKARTVKQKIDECAAAIERKNHEWEMTAAELEKLRATD